MKRSLALLLLCAALTPGCTSSTPEKRPSQDVSQRRKTATFWQAYREATRLRMAGRFDRAARAYRETLTMRPGHLDSLYYLGSCYLELGEYERAASVYRQLVERNPSSQRGYGALGRALSSRAPRLELHLAEAEQAFRRNAVINPEQSGPFLRLGRLLLGQGKLKEAGRQFQTAQGFGSPQGTFLAGYLAWRRGQKAQAVRAWRRVLGIAEREGRISARGVRAEGDLSPAAGPLSSLRGAVYESRLYLHWTCSSAPGCPGVPAEAAWSPPLLPWKARRLRVVPSSGGRGAWLDLDGDGDLDLALIVQERVRFYLNHEGRLQSAGPSLHVPGAWDLLWGDYDGDGRADLYVLARGWIGRGQNRLFQNRGSWTSGSLPLRDVTERAGLRGRRSTVCALFSDLDGDGRADLLEGGVAGEKWPSLRLFHNTGHRFERLAGSMAAGGIVTDLATADIDGDGDADLAVLRWKRPPLLFQNQGGRFRDVSREAGLPQKGEEAFSLLFFDFNRDGKPDLLLTRHFDYPGALGSLLQRGSGAQQGCRLFQNQGEGHFREVTREQHLECPPAVIEARAADIDGDGWQDLILALGGLEEYERLPSLVLGNLEGRRFALRAFLPDAASPSRSLGVAAADFNRDHRSDLYLSQTGLFTFR